MRGAIFQGRASFSVRHVAIERRRLPRLPAFVAASGLRVELLEPEVAALHRDDWSALCAAAVEPNMFLDPDFALSAAQHFAAARRPQFLLIRSVSPQGARLIGLAALERGLRGKAQALWSHPYAALGTPLLRQEQAAETLAALLDWLAERRPAACGLLMPGMKADGPVAETMRGLEQAEGAFALLDSHERATLPQGDASLSRRSGEIMRLRRKLAGLGQLAFRLTGDAGAVRNDLERFLALEASGWKGRAGTALISHAGDSTFARAAIRQMACRGLARIARLDLDGRPIAMGIVLQAGDRAAFWKIAYDPEFAKYSPGVQLTLALSDDLMADTSISLTDSCAVENHPMINRLWPGRQAVADILVGLDGDASAFRRVLKGETLRRSLRLKIKTLYRRLRPAKAA